MDLLLGLDVGTTATKAVLFDLGGKAVASATYHYGLITPQALSRAVEQDPDALWRGVVEQVGQEGCLSFPDVFVDIKRPMRVTVEFTDLKGEQRELPVDPPETVDTWEL